MKGTRFTGSTCRMADDTGLQLLKRLESSLLQLVSCVAVGDALAVTDREHTAGRESGTFVHAVRLQQTNASNVTHT